MSVAEIRMMYEEKDLFDEETPCAELDEPVDLDDVEGSDLEEYKEECKSIGFEEDETEYWRALWSQLYEQLVLFQEKVVKDMVKLDEHVFQRLTVLLEIKEVELEHDLDMMISAFQSLLKYHRKLGAESSKIADSDLNDSEKTGSLLECWGEYDLVDDELGNLTNITTIYGQLAYYLDYGIDRIVKLREEHEDIDCSLTVSERILGSSLRETMVLPVFNVSKYMSIFSSLDENLQSLFEHLITRHKNIVTVVNEALEKQRATQRLKGLEDRMNKNRNDKFKVDLFIGNKDRMCVTEIDVKLYRKKKTSFKKFVDCTLILCNDSLMVADVQGGVFGVHHVLALKGLILLDVPDHGQVQNAFRVFPELKKFGGLTLVLPSADEKTRVINMIESYIPSNDY